MTTPAPNQQALQATAENRRLVVGAALASGAVGLFPAPVLGDLLIDGIRAALLRELARRRGLSLSLVAALRACGARRPELARSALAGLLALLGRGFGRQLFRLLLLALRFEDVARTFVQGTLFDYHCLAHPPDGAIDEEQAERLRGLLRAAEERARLELLARAFQRATSEVVRAGTWLPRRLGGLALALLGGRREEIADSVELDRENLFGWLRELLDREIHGAEQALLEDLCGSFEAAWSARGGLGASAGSRPPHAEGA